MGILRSREKVEKLKKEENENESKTLKSFLKKSKKTIDRSFKSVILRKYLR